MFKFMGNNPELTSKFPFNNVIGSVKQALHKLRRKTKMKKIACTLLTLILISTLTACGDWSTDPSSTVDFTAAPAGVAPRVYLSKNRTIGSTVYLDVMVDTVNNLRDAVIKIVYDVSKVQWGGSHTLGSLLAGGLDSSGLDGGLEGSFVIDVVGTGDVPGNGVIVTIPFMVIALGDSPITIDAVGSVLTDSFSNPLTIDTWDGGTISWL